MSANAAALLKRSFPLIPQHGFTRKTIMLASGRVSTREDGEESNGRLSETAISALFGAGDNARRTLIEAWFKEGIVDMGASQTMAKENATSLPATAPPTLSDLLQRRLEWNKPVNQHLPEVGLLFLRGSFAHKI